MPIARQTALVLGVLATLVGGAGVARAEIQERPVISVVAGGGASIRIGGRVVWRAQSARTRVASDVVWSRARDAVAFATREASGRMKLLVVMVGGELHGQVVSFAIPSRPEAVRRPVVTWLDRQRIVVGASELQPALVASWKVASR